MTTTKQYRNIRATMMKHGVMLKEIAAQQAVTESYVTFVVTGRRVGHRIRRAIAEACGVPVTELWPDEEDPELRRAA